MKNFSARDIILQKEKASCDAKKLTLADLSSECVYREWCYAASKLEPYEAVLLSSRRIPTVIAAVRKTKTKKRIVSPPRGGLN